VVVTFEGKEVLTVEGHECEEGEEYVKGEIEDPKRILTTTVRVRGGTAPLVSVRTSAPIPRDMLEEAMRHLARIRLNAPVQPGQSVVDDLLGTGVSVVTTKGAGKAV
jgi:CxxC motif-containing protein